MQHTPRHIKLALAGDQVGLLGLERITHFVLGLLELIPLLGHLIAWADKKIHATSIKILTLSNSDPYKRGLEHGSALKKEIQELYRLILKIKDSPDLRAKAKLYEKNIPEEFIREMEGLAMGAQVPYEDVLFIHTFLDAQPGTFGCTSMARRFDHGAPEKRIAAANHPIYFESFLHSTESIDRRKKFLESKATDPQKILESANIDQTIQSIIFNPREKSISVSASGGNAAYEPMATFKSEDLFTKAPMIPHEGGMELLRNLDWPWYFLGQNTLILKRNIGGKEVATVTFPGYIGSLSGMNEDGLCLAANNRGGTSNIEGIPNPLLFTKILATCATVTEAERHLMTLEHGSSMNVVLADPYMAQSFEMDEFTTQVVGKIDPILQLKAAG